MWAHNRSFRLLGVIVAVVLLVLGLFYYDKIAKKSCDLALGSSCVRLERVTTNEARQKGLSGRNRLADDQGMLFVFERSGKYCFWMKDMKFPIDIIWTDSGKKVVAIEKDVQPNTYPDSFCTQKPALYVLEFSSGFANRHSIGLGDQLRF